MALSPNGDSESHSCFALGTRASRGGHERAFNAYGEPSRSRGEHGPWLTSLPWVYPVQDKGSQDISVATRLHHLQGQQGGGVYPTYAAATELRTVLAMRKTGDGA